MLVELSKDPIAFAGAVLNELSARRVRLDASQVDGLVNAMGYAVRTTAYAIKGRALLTRPLVERKIPIDGTDWASNGIKLYGLWQKMRPAVVEQRMAELREANKGVWQRTFPDDWDIDEKKLRETYQSAGPLLANGMHAWSETSTAIRYFATEQIAPIAGERGFFDWGGSDGISCIFAHQHGARDVNLYEPNAAAREFGKWLSGQLGMTIEFHEQDPTPPAEGGRQFGAGICTEVLEHVVDPPGMMRRLHDLLVPGGVIFVTSSFGVPQDTHLKQNQKFHGREKELMRQAGFAEWTPPVPPPMPMLPQWGFWQRVK